MFASAHVYPLYDTWLERLTAPFADPDVALAMGARKATTNEVLRVPRPGALVPADSVARQDHPFCNNANAADPAIGLGVAAIRRGADRSGGPRLGEAGGGAGNDRLCRRRTGHPRHEESWASW